MGEFGSNNEDNERKEKTSERAREREGGEREGERSFAPGSRKGKERKRKELFFFERGLSPLIVPLFRLFLFFFQKENT